MTYGEAPFGEAGYGESPSASSAAPTATLAGTFPAWTGALNAAVTLQATLAAQIPPLASAAQAYVATDVQLAASVPGFTSDLAIGVTAEMGLASTLQPWTTAFAGANYFAVSGHTQTLTFTVPDGYPQITGAMEVVIPDDHLDRAPTTVEVTVSNCAELDDLTFAIDGMDVFVEASDVDGFLDLTSIPVPEELVAGTHTLSVTSAIKGTSTATFTLDRGAAARPATKTPDAAPVFVPASQDGDRFHWVLQDLAPGGLGSWVMPVSPASMSNPHRRRNVVVQHTTAVDGSDHAFEGHMPPLDWQFAGYCPDQAFYDQLQAYMNLNRRFYVIDHRGRAWTVAGLSVDLRPRKRQSVNGTLSDWHHDYTANCALLDQDWKEPV